MWPRSAAAATSCRGVGSGASVVQLPGAAASIGARDDGDAPRQLARRLARERGKGARDHERTTRERLRPLRLHAGLGHLDAGLGQPADDVAVRLVVEEATNRLRQLIADAAQLVELHLGGAKQPL